MPSYDWSVWPYCSPDFNDEAFRGEFVSITKSLFVTTSNNGFQIDFPCNMKIEHAMFVPLLMSLVALVFCTALYFMLKHTQSDQRQKRSVIQEPSKRD